MDDSFGPRLFGHFDFTLLFEHTIFHIAPSLILLFTLPYYVHKIITSRPVVRPGWLLWAKLAVAVAIAAVQLATVVFWYRSPLNSRVAQAAAILSFLSSIGVIIMAYASHACFVQPVLFLASYLNVTLLLDLATIYTYFHRTSLDGIARLTCALPALKFVLLVLEEISKRSLILAGNRDQLGSELTAGFWSRSTFLWINPLLLFGFHNVIDNEYLPDIGHQFDSKQLYDNLKECWDRQNQKSKYALLRALVRSMPWPFIYVILPRLFLVGFNFSQPFLLQDIVNAASGEVTQPDYVSKEEEVTALILATALVFCGKAISRNWFSHIRNQTMVCIRGAVISAIYQKSLRIGVSESEDSAAITLMSTDVPGMEHLVSLIYDTCAMVLEVGFGIAVLVIFVGVASVFTIITALIVTVCSKHMAKQMAVTRKRWNEHIEERVAATSNILAQMKDVKMAGLAPSMAMYLNELRAKEVEVSLSTRRITCITFGISAFADTVTPAVVVAAALFWSRAAQPMSTARFYTILAVVTMIAQPLAAFFASLPDWSASFACLFRIQSYLAQVELKDPRRIARASATGSSSATSPLGAGSTNPAGRPQYAIQLEGVNVSMDLTGSILRDASIRIKVGEVTMIHGSVGCGKSTLLKVMLGEMLLRNGTALLSSPSIAFAGQRPWLLNTTIRLNIIGHKVYNHALYESIIFICALRIDFDALPNGDQTIVGSGGFNLSGGQKQRISIARALYVEADVTILDDPFSSLDRETSALIRIRLISDGNATPNGRTLVMTTSMKQHLVDANNAFRVTEEGHVIPLTLQQVNDELEELARNHRSQGPSSTEHSAIAERSSEPPAVQQVSDDNSDNAGRNVVDTHGSLSLYLYFFRPAGLLRVAIWLVFVILASISERLPNIFVRIWLDTDAGNKRYFIGYAIFCAAHPVFNCFSAMFFYYFVSASTANRLHENLVNATFRATYEFLATEDAGSILNRFSSDMSMATQRVPALIMPTVFRAITIFIDIGIISAGAEYAAPVIPFFLGFILAIQQYYLRTSRQLRVLELDASKKLVRHFTETAAGIEHIRAFRWQAEVTNDFFSILDFTQRPFYFLLCIQQWLECTLDFTSAVAAVLVVTFALKFSNTASANSMGLALLSLIGFSNTISEWVQPSVAMETAFGAVSRIRSYCARTPTEKYRDDKEPVSSAWPAEGQLELNCVSAIYRADATPQVSQINNVTAIVQPGETLGIVGRTGSGKTTVLLSILNLLQYKGTISIDDREIRTIPPDLLRARMTTVTQGGIHLRGSVRFNLDPFHPALRSPTCIVTNQMYQDALHRVGLWGIISRRGDLTSRMKDMNLSQGQRQLFQLARAILHHEVTGSKIVLMDEATSSLDEDTEAQIMTVIDNAFQGCTRVIISHRYATLDNSNAVMVLNQGQARVIRHTPGQTDWRHQFR